MRIKLYHEGKFTKTSYLGGTYYVVPKQIHIDRYGFADLAENIKDRLGYTETGGIYVKDENGEWKTIADDKDIMRYMSRFSDEEEVDFYLENIIDNSVQPCPQVQPHLVIRPRQNIFQALTMKPKRKFVTIQGMKKQEKTKKVATKNQRQKEDKSIYKEEVDSGRKAVSYEQQREINIASNKEHIAALKLPSLAAALSGPGGTKVMEKSQNLNDDDDYVPNNENLSGGSSEEEREVPTKEPKQFVKQQVHGRRITRSTASSATNVQVEEGNITSPFKMANKKKTENIKNCATSVTQEKATTLLEQPQIGQVQARKKIPPSSPSCNTRLKKRKAAEGVQAQQVEQNIAAEQETSKLNAMKGIHGETMPPSIPTTMKRLPFDAPGSMVELLASHEVDQQKKNGRSLLQETEAGELGKSTGESSKKNKRGRTMMALVHLRKFEDRKPIPLNARFQPASADSRLISEFSRLLGTLARQFVPLTYFDWRKVPDKECLWEYVKEKYIIAEEGHDWVMKTIGDLWRGYKGRTKEKFYSKYSNDEDRLKNRPKHIPIDEFKVLLAYWGDEKVQQIAEKNAESRRKITETHTAGPTSFAQVTKTMEISSGNGAEPSKVEIYMKIRERKEGRKYKLPTNVVNYKLSTLKKMRSSGANSDTIDQIVSGDSAHSTSYLVGRVGCLKKQPESAGGGASSSQSFDVQALSSEIEEKLKLKMEETVNQKVKENMAIIVKQLAEVYPGLNLAIDLDVLDEVESQNGDNASSIEK